MNDTLDTAPVEVRTKGRWSTHNRLPTALANAWLAVARNAEHACYRYDSAYVETYWTPNIGPTAFLLYRRLGAWAEAAGAELCIGLDELGYSVGVTPRSCRDALLRLDQFKFIDCAAGGDAFINVRLMVPPLSWNLAARLREKCPTLGVQHDIERGLVR